MKVIKPVLLFFSMLIIQMPGVIGQNPLKIMPLGNSITQGWTDGIIPVSQMKGYRYDLKALLQADGFNIDFVGSEVSGNDYFSDCQHAGIGGSRDQYVARLLIDGYDDRNDIQILVPPRPYLDEYNPDIILLHIGTNDITHEADPISIQQVSYILDLIDQYEARSGREVIVFLARIINRKKPWVAGSGAASTTALNNYIETMALSRIASGDKLVIVDQENDAGFLYDDTDMIDLVHPNNAGYSKMASLWRSSIIDNYNTAPTITPIPNQTIDEGSSTNSLVLDDYVADLQDTDPNLTWTVTQIGTPNLSITIDDNRRVTAAPLDNNWFGTQSAVFTVTDQGKNGKYIKSSSDTVIYTVNAVNDVPTFVSNPILTIEEGQLYSYVFSASDPDAGDVLSYSLPTKPSWLTLYADSKLLAGIPQDPGNYNVILRVSDGLLYSDQSFVIEITGLSPVIENETDNRIRIYPNPATDHFRLSFSDRTEDIEFTLFDVTGKPVLKRHICSTCEPLIDIRQVNIKPGLYFFKVILNNEIHNGKLIINQ